MRNSQIQRKTKETDIQLFLNIDGNGKSEIATGCGFLDHMLTLLSHHSRFDLTVKCCGDTHVDYHHTVEDVGIALGMALTESLGTMNGINRYGSFLLPMDEALMQCALDISGRGFLAWNVSIPTEKVGDFDTELAEEFFRAVVRTANITLHFNQLAGTNSHHIIEAVFKAFARALSAAVKINPELQGEIPSSKGVLL